MINKKISICLVFFSFIFVNIFFVSALEPNFQVTAFSCSPSENVINTVFSCTATITNNGDTSGTLGTATLYPDPATDWLEEPTYAQSYGSSVGVSESVSITFTGLRAVKSGNNAFDKIMLDSSEDGFTNVPGGAPEMNIINVAVTVSNSASSVAMGGTFDSTAEVTAGGNIDVSLTFTVNSGGCSIGSQTNPKTISGMTDGSKQSRTWTVTQGTSGNCRYTVSASATGEGGVASKVDSTTSSVTCSNCPTDSGSTSTSGGGGGSGAAGSKIYVLDELSSPASVELAVTEKVKFNISNKEHILTLINVTETSVTITVESKKQTFTLVLEEEKNIDLDEDSLADIIIKLKSVNIITKKANIIISPILGEKPFVASEGEKQETEEKKGKPISEVFKGLGSKIWIILIILIVIIALVVYYLSLKKTRRKHYGY